LSGFAYIIIKKIAGSIHSAMTDLLGVGYNPNLSVCPSIQGKCTIATSKRPANQLTLFNI